MAEPAETGFNVAAREIRPGTVIADRYRVEGEIGTGGMSTIFRGTHLTLNRPIAIKFIEVIGPNSARVRERFLREARVAAAVRHRNVVDILDFGTADGGTPFMVMELLQGLPLASKLGAAMSVAEVVGIMARLLSGLSAVHDSGIVHRDLKPENVFLVRDADGEYPKLLDFGVSRALDPASDLQSVLPTRENAIVGTPQYMSPEQARGLRALDHRSDIWSAGVMLYELLTGRLPFDAEAVGDVIIQIATEEPPDFAEARPDLAGPIEAVVKRAMEKSPDRRFQTAREMRSALLSAVKQVAANLQTPAGDARGRRGQEQLLSSALLEAVDAATEASELPSAETSLPPESAEGSDAASSRRSVTLTSGERLRPADGDPATTAAPAAIARTSRGRKAVVATLTGVFIAVGIITLTVGATLLRLADATPATTAPPGPSVQEGVTASPTVRITLQEVPEGAIVSVDGVPQEGVVPLLPRDGRAHTITVEEGARSWSQSHVADRDARYTVSFDEPPAGEQAAAEAAEPAAEAAEPAAEAAAPPSLPAEASDREAQAPSAPARLRRRLRRGTIRGRASASPESPTSAAPPSEPSRPTVAPGLRRDPGF